LTWLRNRLYDPATRQFVAPDPLPGVPGTTVAANPYHYGSNDPVGMVDPLGLEPLSIDAYNEIREQETGMQWGNIAMGALMVGSFFIPGGPIVATLVGAGMGMAPGIIQGVTTGNWDVGEIVQGAVVGGIAGRVGFAFGGSGSTLTTSVLRGAAGGAATGTVGQAYDVLPLPGSDGQFDLEDVALETVIGGATGGMAHRPGSDTPDLFSSNSSATNQQVVDNNLGLPRTPATVDDIANRAGVDLDGVNVNIVEDPDYIRYLDYQGACACTPGELNGTQIDLGPASFVDEPTLAATLAHERQHVQQLLDGRTVSSESLADLEAEAYGVEADAVDRLRGGS
jgi:hypothetical protein